VKRTAIASTVLLLLIPAALSGCGGSEGSASAAQASTTPAGATLPDETKAEEDQDAISVAVGAVRREPLSSLYSTSATLRADKRATITARTTGVVRMLLVEEGDRVETGEPLAELENDEQKISFQRASTASDTLMRDFQRTRRLHQDGLVSDEEFETKRRESEDAQHAAALAELELSRTIIKAPFSGIILTRHLDVGATVADGTAVYDLADLEPLYADVSVPERHVVHLSPGQEVRLTADARDLVLPALIERIAPVVDPSTGTVKVTLAVSGESEVRPGAFVRVDIVTDTHGEALVVPRPALVAEGRRWLLFRLDENDRVKQLEVLLGYEEGERVEILEVLEPADALEPGTPIVVAGAPALTDGALVRVIENGREEGDAEDEAGVTP